MFESTRFQKKWQHFLLYFLKLDKFMCRGWFWFVWQVYVSILIKIFNNDILFVYCSAFLHLQYSSLCVYKIVCVDASSPGVVEDKCCLIDEEKMFDPNSHSMVFTNSYCQGAHPRSTVLSIVSSSPLCFLLSVSLLTFLSMVETCVEYVHTAYVWLYIVMWFLKQ